MTGVLKQMKTNSSISLEGFEGDWLRNLILAGEYRVLQVAFLEKTIIILIAFNICLLSLWAMGYFPCSRDYVVLMWSFSWLNTYI